MIKNYEGSSNIEDRWESFENEARSYNRQTLFRILFHLLLIFSPKIK